MSSYSTFLIEGLFGTRIHSFRRSTIRETEQNTIETTNPRQQQKNGVIRNPMFVFQQ
jgi:hypothetical protein